MDYLFRCHERIREGIGKFDGEKTVRKEKSRPEWFALEKKNAEIQVTA